MVLGNANVKVRGLVRLQLEENLSRVWYPRRYAGD
jgi:hypothetical protein